MNVTQLETLYNLTTNAVIESQHKIILITR